MGDISVVDRAGGKKSYKARVRGKGQPTLSKTFRRKTDANKWISTIEAKHFEGKVLSKTNRVTVAQAIDRYITEIIPHKKLQTQKIQVPMLEFWKKQLGALRLVEVNYENLERVRKHLLTVPATRKHRQKPQMRGNTTVNRYFANLRHVFKVAIKNWQWIENNPVSRMKQLPEPRGRTRFLTDKELSILLNALDDHERKDFRLIVLIALTTGCRRSNAQSIHWEHIDYENKTIIFPDTKNNEPHVVSITDELVSELKKYQLSQGKREGALFPIKAGSKNKHVDVKGVWIRLIKKLGIEDLHS